MAEIGVGDRVEVQLYNGEWRPARVLIGVRGNKRGRPGYVRIQRSDDDRIIANWPADFVRRAALNGDPA